MDVPYNPESPLYNPESPLSLNSDNVDDFCMDQDNLDISHVKNKECSDKRGISVSFESKNEISLPGEKKSSSTARSKSAKFVPAFKENIITSEVEEAFDHMGKADFAAGMNTILQENVKQSDDMSNAEDSDQNIDKNVKKKKPKSKEGREKDRKRKPEKEKDKIIHNDNHHEKKKHKKRKKESMFKSPDGEEIKKIKEKRAKSSHYKDKLLSKNKIYDSEENLNANEDDVKGSSQQQTFSNKSKLPGKFSEINVKDKSSSKENASDFEYSRKGTSNVVMGKSSNKKEKHTSIKATTAHKSSKNSAIATENKGKDKHQKNIARESSKQKETYGSKTKNDLQHEKKLEESYNHKRASKRKRKHSSHRSSSSDSKSSKRRKHKHSERSEKKKEREKDHKSKHNKKKHSKVYTDMEKDSTHHENLKKRDNSHDKHNRRSHSSSRSKDKKSKHNNVGKKEKSRSKHKKHPKNARSASPEHFSKSKKKNFKDDNHDEDGTVRLEKTPECHINLKKSQLEYDNLNKKNEPNVGEQVSDGSFMDGSNIDDSEKIHSISEKSMNEQFVSNIKDSDKEIEGSEIEVEKDNMIPMTEDTDSEFERLSDLEKEIEKEKILLKADIHCKSDFSKETIVDSELFDKKSEDLHDQSFNLSDNLDENNAKEKLENRCENKVTENKECKECSSDQVSDGSANDLQKNAEILELKSSSSIQAVQVKTAEEEEREDSPESVIRLSSISMLSQKPDEKRTFTLFSKEQAVKLDEELRGVENGEGKDEEQRTESINKEDDDVDELEGQVKSLYENNSEDNKGVENENQEKDGLDDALLTQPYRKSKDDLFDDIFSQEAPPAKENDGFAKVLGHADGSDTSPKLLSPKIIKKFSVSNIENSTEHQNLKVKKECNIENQEEKPDIKSMKKEVIPGLEFSSIPGLSIKKESEIEIAGELIYLQQENKGAKEKSEKAKIPLLFDTDSSPDKALTQRSPCKKDENDFKKPHTPPGEFTGETENNQFESYYHVEDGSDSPYNPEDQSVMDMNLSPVDQNMIQKDALRQTVELRLKEPFSGFENPTWEKILRAKSKHEALRHNRKKDDIKRPSLDYFSKSNEQHGRDKSEKMVDYLVRQSRVEQECKEILKQYYKSKDITKEEYKKIMRKAVPQVTMSNRPIIPEKIRSLMKKFVGKCKGQRLLGSKSTINEKSGNYTPPTYSQGLTLPGEQRFRYLNPDLPMPPF